MTDYQLSMLTKKAVAPPLMALVIALLLAISACRADPAPETTPLPTTGVVLIPTRGIDNPAATVTIPAENNATVTATSVPPSEATAVPPTVVRCTPQSGWPTYTVQRGDTLGEIAQAAGSSVSELTQANCLSNPNLLEVGQTIYVPRAVVFGPTPTATTPADNWVAYADPDLQVTYDYPAAWTMQHGSGGDTRFEGRNGFIYAMAMSGGTDLETMTKNEAEHVLLPYGPNPTIEKITLSNGQEGRLILPSAAPTAGIQQQAAFLTPYPNPILLNGVKINYLYIVADPAHIRHVAESVQMPPIPGGIEVKFFSAEVLQTLPNGGRRIQFTWDSNGATYGQIFTGTSQRFINSWPVGPADTLTVDLANTIFPNPLMTLQVFNEVTGEEALATVTVEWPCAYNYFFTPAPERCPTAAPQVVTGAYQSFEKGWMVWRPDSTGNYIYVFLNSGDVYQFSDTWHEGDPISDPNIVPPNGREQPVRGFGKVWRENSHVRNGLGWATAAETTYTLKFQVEIRESLPSVSYLTRPQGDLLKLTETKWEVWSATQKE